MKKNKKILATLFLSQLFVFMFIGHCSHPTPCGLSIPVFPNGDAVLTAYLQQAIDSVSTAGGGTVLFAPGKYVTGGLYMQNNVTLKFKKSAILQSSSDLADFGEWNWGKALIMGDSLKNISIIGEGLIDGIDLANPNGEEGFRGPHVIRFTNCDSLVIKDITVKRSANWAINCRKCSNGNIENVTIHAGHDGVHTRFCQNFHINNCDIRTGDDAFAGNDNQNFVIENCKANTSCNAFRFGCYNLIIRNCSIWGPGEYIHLSQHRNNTLSAFTHFSPPDENPQLQSGNWLIQDVTVDNVDQIFNYNFKDGLWQTGQPATDITFENLTATRLKKAFNMTGDSSRTLKLTIRNSTICEQNDSDFSEFIFEGRTRLVPAFININQFNSVEMQDVTIETNSNKPAVMAKNGNSLVMQNIQFVPADNRIPNIIEHVNVVEK